MTAIEKSMFNRLMAVDCPNCGLEVLSTDPYPAAVHTEVQITCGGCGGVGATTMRPEWQYTDINAYPLEQALNRRYPHSPHRAPAGSQQASGGTLVWD